MASIENPYCYIVTKLQSYKTDFQHILCLVADGHTMVGTQTYSPHDNSLSINDYQLAPLLRFSKTFIFRSVIRSLNSLRPFIP